MQALKQQLDDQVKENGVLKAKLEGESMDNTHSCIKLLTWAFIVMGSTEARLKGNVSGVSK